MNKAQKLLVALIAASTLSSTSFASENNFQIGVFAGGALSSAIPETNIYTAPDKADDKIIFKGTEMSKNFAGGLDVAYYFDNGLLVGATALGFLTSNNLLPEKPENTTLGKAAAARAESDGGDEGKQKKAVEDLKESLTITSTAMLGGAKLGYAVIRNEDLQVDLSGVIAYGRISFDLPVHNYAKPDAKPEDKPEEKKLEHLKTEDLYSVFTGPQIKISAPIAGGASVGIMGEALYQVKTEVSSPINVDGKSTTDKFNFVLGNMIYVVALTLDFSF